MSDTAKQNYPTITPKLNLPEVEERILKMWEEDKTFEKSVKNRHQGDNGDNEFVFYDGPPFANGLPHYGHLLTGYVKDMIPRYQTMKGRKVERRFGWDCHGLPAEMSAEKELGFSGRDKIIEFGVKKFNDYCRESVFKYAKEWERQVKRQARWVDFENDYKTLDISYMESVIWAFKTLHDKGLVYEGTRILPYSWAAEATVSNFETRMDNAYREREDPAITVAFTLDPVAGEESPMKILVWTTTPWTLPSNLALAVGADIEYAIYKEDGICYLLANALVGKYTKVLEKAQHVGMIKGSELVGRSYTPLFDYFKDTKNSFKVLAGDFVSTEDGTGTVHLAPGFGEDDHAICVENDIPVICPVDSKGCFTSLVPNYKGQLVFDTNKPIIRDLKNRGILIKHEQYKHSYPHCWRTDEPLIYKAISSWFVKVSDIKDRMVELNQQITWAPEHIKDGQFGKWLENARDWSISRQRFWGTPIPVWKSDDPSYPRVDIYSSLDEIEADFGVKPTTLHRPEIDDLVRPNPDDPTGKSTMRRVTDVFDCWFESGSMPFAQVHYPFENKDWFEAHFPADFIVEYIAQTRGWFYTLMVLGTALFDKPPFLNCICHGVVLDENAQKLSKRLRNYPSPDEVFGSHGSDALRWFLISSNILRGGNLSIDRKGTLIAKSARQVIIPLWNAFHFFCLYANIDKIKAEFDTSSDHVLDRYVLSKYRLMSEAVESNLNNNDIPGACSSIVDFTDVLTNWYLRRSRSRFWANNEADGASIDKQRAYNTLYSVITLMARNLAPFLPLLTEEIYRSLTGEESVHLSDWPDFTTLPNDVELTQDMDAIRAICSTVKSLREVHNLRNRLPLPSMTLAGEKAKRLEPFFSVIQDEVNIKSINVASDLDDVAETLMFIKTPIVGKRLGKKMKGVLAASKAGEWQLNDDGSVTIDSERLETHEFELRIKPLEGMTGEALLNNEMMVTIDTDVTPELEREGLARDFVRHIQTARKEHGFQVSDRIKVHYFSNDKEILSAFDENQEYISEQILAVSLQPVNAEYDGEQIDISLGGGNVKISLEVSS
ncbi:MAG: isoleucine--tRNA ligase [Magnetococcales bacterium]|nr:isoleucine--tRNA ligase [Magnetococcales bacterium]